MQVDHVLLGSDGPLPSGSVLPWRGKLDSFAGGRHPGWGTANRIIPLGDAYLELVSIVDEDEARSSQFGLWALDAAMRPGLPFGWAVRPSDFDATLERLGLDVHDGSRTTPSGEVVRWRMAGLAEAVDRPWLPFLLDWCDPSTFPGRLAPTTATLRRISILGDVAELADWLGLHDLPLDVTQGDEGVVSVVVDTPAGALVVG
jgi:hypothetical protein